MKKMAFFCSEAWVNPFGKMRFMGLAKIFVIIVKKVSFFFKKSLSIFSSLILTNLNKEKFGIFWPKGWVNPFGEWDFWDFYKNFLWSKKVSLLSRTLLNLCSQFKCSCVKTLAFMTRKYTLYTNGNVLFWQLLYRG